MNRGLRKWKESLSISYPYDNPPLISQERQCGSCGQVFSCEFCKISKKTFFTDHLWATVFVSVTDYYQATLIMFSL